MSNNNFAVGSVKFATNVLRFQPIILVTGEVETYQVWSLKYYLENHGLTIDGYADLADLLVKLTARSDNQSPLLAFPRHIKGYGSAPGLSRLDKILVQVRWPLDIEIASCSNMRSIVYLFSVDFILEAIILVPNLNWESALVYKLQPQD